MRSAHRPRPALLSPTAVVLVSAAVLLIASEASAYIIPTEFMCRLLADRRRGMGISDLSLTITTQRGGDEIEERIYLKSPERMRRAGVETGAKIYVENEGGYATGTEGALKKQKGVPPGLLATLLMPGGAELEDMAARMLAAMKRHGIKTDLITLGRFSNSVVYIVGANSWETDKPQVWFDKATTLPVRYLTKDASGTVTDVRLKEYGSEQSGEWFPRVVEVYVNGKRSERLEVVSVESNQKLPESMFALPSG